MRNGPGGPTAPDLLLIHPPVVRPSEPPLATAMLAGSLSDAGARVETLDLNVEAFHRFLGPGDEQVAPSDLFSRRALRQRAAALATMRSQRELDQPGRYRSAVSHLQRILWLRSGKGEGPKVTFTDYRHPRLSPLRRRDLLDMATDPQAGALQEAMWGIVLDRVGRHRPRWVGLSMNYLSQVLPTMALIGLLRKDFPHQRVAVGGNVVTAWGDRICGDPDLATLVDRWIPGPGEGPLARLLGKGNSDPHPPREPRYDGFPWPLYLSPERVIPFLTARGCYWGRCRFCPEAVSGEVFRPSPVEVTFPMLRRALSRNEASWVHFMDDAIPPSILRALAQEALGVRWFGFVRFESLLLDAGFVRRLRRRGCRMLQLGLESGSQRVLDVMNKGIRLQDASRALKVLHDEGIGTYVYVMFGMPGETLDEARRTLAFVADHAPWIDFLNCAIMNLPHGEDKWEGLERIPFSSDEELSLYTDFRSLGGMDRKTARRFLHREFRRHPAVAPILRRDPPAFSSSHAPFFLRTTTHPKRG